jgi:hypothetical protein
MEEFRLMNDFDNYEVSNFGNVRNIKTGRILKGKDDTHGYLIVCLYKDKKKKTKSIHRLVAEAFIDNPENKLCVDHNDGNVKNNDITNLRFATVSENIQNSKIRKDNTSGAKGVTWDKNANKWKSRIMIDGIQINLGLYDTFEDAKEARVKRANEVFGVYTNECEKIKLT